MTTVEIKVKSDGQTCRVTRTGDRSVANLLAEAIYRIAEDLDDPAVDVLADAVARRAGRLR